MSRNLIILLHGVGSSGADLAPLGDLWRQKLPDTDFVAPDAPLAFGPGPGRQWFSINGVTEANRSQRVAAARADFDRLLGDLSAAAALSDRLDRVALVGFSQGSIMALDALVSGRWPVAGILAFSGRLASPLPWTPSLATKLLLIHGSVDPVIPSRESDAARTLLSQAGVSVDLRILPGVGHTISGEGAALGGDFLSGLF
ncbi:MAG: dienelactone hydrolase family protein [Azospirillaceae bacterium]|nr:dienelactone hydrolase family protein [Azospirillaceae bacterium]